MGFVSFSEKLLIAVALILIVAGTIIAINEWRGEYLYQFFFTGQWENLVYLVVFAWAIAYILQKLAKMQAHNLFGRHRR